MDITIEKVTEPVAVTIMSLAGELDASTYQEPVSRTRDEYAAGMRDLLLDLSQLSFMASSGLIALHNMAMVLRGKLPADEEEGWGSFHSIANAVEDASGHERHLKLLNPQPRIEKSLQATGFDQLLVIYHDRDEALASFAVAEE